jgi:hypothetical protein
LKYRRIIETAMKRHARQIAILIGLISVTGLDAQNQSATSWSPAIEPLASPAGANSAQPQLSSSSRGVILSWVEHDGSKATLRFAERTAKGWSDARAVASGSDWFVNWADVPSVIRLANGTLVAHWLQKSGSDTYAYDVRLTYSNDDGNTWSPSFTPHSDGTKTEHGFASLFQIPGAGLGLVWLDGRGMNPQSASGAEHGATGSMSLRFAAYDPDWKRTLDMPVDLRVCECCPTTAAVTSDGPIAAFRNRTDDEVRDIYVSRLEAGRWTEPKAVYNDGWRINACPVNGPMLSANGRNVALAWFTGKDDVGRAFVAFSKDAARSFGLPIRLDDASTLGRVDVELLPDGSAIATWIEFSQQHAQFRMRRVESTGARSAPVTVSTLSGSRSSGYPRVAVAPGEILFAWTENADGGSRVRTAAARLAK